MQWPNARERFATRAMLLALFLALAAPDHWDLPTGWLGGGEHRHAAAEEEKRHAEHCHIDAAKCSDTPATAISGLALLAHWLALPAAFELAGGLRDDAARLNGGTPAVPTPPPRPAATGANYRSTT